MVQTVQISVEIPHAQFLAKVIDVPVIFNDTCQWWPRQCSSRTRLLTCPLFQRHVPVAVQTVQFSPSSVEPVEIPQVQFLDKFFMPVVVMSGADGQTVLKTVKIPQVRFLDKLFMPVVFVWCQWPDNAENCGDSTGAVLGQGVPTRCCCGADGQTMQKTVVMPQLLLFVVKVLKTVEVPQYSSSTWLALFMDKGC